MGCARPPVRAPAAPDLVAPENATVGAARLAPALEALHAAPATLARRPPRPMQCVQNPLARRVRESPSTAAAWPPPSWQSALGPSEDPDRVVAWALSSEPDPAQALPNPVALSDAVAAWSRGAAAARARLAQAIPAGARADVLRLAAYNRVGPLPPSASGEARAEATRASAERRAAYCRLAPAIDGADIAAALAMLWAASRLLESAAAAQPMSSWPPTLQRWTTEEGFIVVVGSTGGDRVSPGWHLWLDPGGDDEVDAWAPEGIGAVQTVIDLGGDDHYRCEGSGAGIAGVVGGLSVLLDRAGDDAYDGGRWSVGGAAFGGAVLCDRAGNDAYTALAAGLGAAFHAVGLLLDVAGDDVYSIGTQGEGFAGPAGFGLLWDGAGDDVYAAGGLMPDTDRDMQHTLSLAQGCGFGLRPEAEGGTGLLIDVSGNDRYRGEIFVQGLGYWGGVGGLWDAAGNDSYTGIQYAQGVGLHFGIGLLTDDAGSDVYAAGGLTQGCGHDFGVGACLDFSGDDRYAAGGLGSGSCSAGGVGIFYDGAGNDRYDASPVTNLGCDASPVDRPGFAMHIDAGGVDIFGIAGLRPDSSTPAKNGAIWFNGAHGVAINAPTEPK